MRTQLKVKVFVVLIGISMLLFGILSSKPPVSMGASYIQSPNSQIRYAGAFNNPTYGTGSVVIDMEVGPTTVSGYINFTNQPGNSALCGAGAFTGTRNGDVIQFGFTSHDPDPGCSTFDGWIFNVSGTLSGNQIVNGSYSVNGENGTFSAAQTTPYTGRFLNPTYGTGGPVQLDIVLETSSVTGYINFSNDPGGGTLCGAGSFIGTRSGDTIQFSFISNDLDSGCTIDDGWVFNVNGTLSGNQIEGSYSIPIIGEGGTFSVATPASDAPFKVYNDVNYVGDWCYSVYPQTNNIHSSCNNKISSVYLDPGWSVKVYRDQDQTGPNACLNQSDGDLRDNTFTDGTPMHDTISSFILYNQTGCNGSLSPGYPLEVYNDADYSGSRCYSSEAETANIHWSCNDKISSILLRSGWSIRVYRDQNQSGPSVCVNSSDANLSENTFSDGSGVNDAISSFVLYDQNNCAGSSAAYPLMVYHDVAYVGGWCYSSHPETENIHPYCNDLISSVLLEPGWSMRVYRDHNQSGPSTCLNGSDNDLTNNTFDDGTPMNDAISSFVLYDEAACSGETSPYPFVVYNDAGYNGSLCYSIQPETNNIHTSCNDQISALKLHSGWSVRVYRDQNQGGTSVCFTGSDSDLSDNTFDDGTAMNDAVSSFALYHQVNCPVPTGWVLRTQDQGFDTCAAPPVATMQTWREYSPYKYVGIYIGGSSRACPQKDLSPAWLSQVADQGWDFIPIWVGPQAPCTTFGNQLSTNTTTAKAQGITEARGAVDAAYSLGLTNAAKGGTVIYYDMERYDTSNVACRNAVDAFLEGWVSELQAYNNIAGVYGSPYNAVYWNDNTPRPDAIWFAIWDNANPNQRIYNPDAAIYDIWNFSNDLWRAARIRQYDGDHTETWGNIGINIDINVADGLVASVDQTRSTLSHHATVPVIQVSDLSQSNIQEIHFFTQSVGWLLSDSQIFWTTTSGEQWNGITPKTDAGARIVSTFFLDSQHGWAVSASNNGTSLRVFRTVNGGRSWQSTLLTGFVPDNGDSAHAVYLDFVDQQTGWITIKLPAGVNFSRGLLFRTTDGGMTWAEQSLPIGDPVHFISSSIGWVAGGPAGDQLYVSRDGGETWRLQVILPSENLNRDLHYGLPVFETTKDGVIPIIADNAIERKAYIYATHDGGETWKLADILSMNAQVAHGKPMMDLLDSSHWIVVGSNTASNLPANTFILDFVTSDIGWVYTRNGTCATEIKKRSDAFGSDGFNCSVEEELLRTIDGGQTWIAVNIPYKSSIYLPLILRNQ